MKKTSVFVLFACLFVAFYGFSQQYSITVNNASALSGRSAYAIVTGDHAAKSAFPFTIGPDSSPFTITLEWGAATRAEFFDHWVVNGVAYSQSESKITVTADEALPSVVVDCVWTRDDTATPAPYAEPTRTPDPGVMQYSIIIDSGIPEGYEQASAKVDITGDRTSSFMLPCKIGPYPEPFTVTANLTPRACCGIQGGTLDDVESTSDSSGLSRIITADDANNERYFTVIFVIWSTPVPGTPEPQPTYGPTSEPATPTPVPAASTPVPGALLGDANGDGSIDIVDALLIAQYYVGLTPWNIILSLADVTRDGNVDIVDALRIAQCYVGLVSCYF